VRRRHVLDNVRRALTEIFRTGIAHGRTGRPERKPGWWPRKRH
jgi:hypothetical protein